MSSTAQRSELQSQIWKISNDVRGSIDGWDFKQYEYYRDMLLSFPKNEEN